MLILILRKLTLLVPFSLEVDNWFRRVWLYMPLMHSENLRDHDLFSDKVQAWQNDPEVQKYPEELKSIGMTANFEAKHRERLFVPMICSRLDD